MIHYITPKDWSILKRIVWLTVAVTGRKYKPSEHPAIAGIAIAGEAIVGTIAA